MFWTTINYPAEMKHLPKEVREQAIAIANMLLKENMEVSAALWIAIDHAKACDELRKALPEHNDEHPHPLLVVPHDNDWAVRYELRKNK
jgi:uncharacterized protein YdaT